MNAKAPIKLLVVDDSAVCRGFILRMFQDEDDVQIVATAGNGQDAIARVRAHDVDVVILDIEMPILNGLEALPGILKARPGLPVIMASSLTAPGAQASLDALSLGASEYVLKPTNSISGQSFDAIQAELRRKVRTLGRRRQKETEAASTAAPALASSALKLRPHERRGIAPRVLAVGASTGGPNALVEFFTELGADFPLPVLLTQHMPPLFTQILAERLQTASGLESSEAEHGEPVRPGKIYVAPGDIHMLVKKELTREVISLESTEPENFCRPAVDPLFRSVAECYHGAAIACVFTGMGEDGRRGAEVLTRSGVPVYVQDEESSVIWGMPGAIARAGLATDMLPPIQLARSIQARVQKGR